MVIKVLGLGCPNCQKLIQNVKQAGQELGLKNFEVEKVTDFEKITAYGVLGLPALVIDEKIKSFGKILTVEAIKKILTELRA